MPYDYGYDMLAFICSTVLFLDRFALEVTGFVLELILKVSVLHSQDILIYKNCSFQYTSKKIVDLLWKTDVVDFKYRESLKFVYFYATLVSRNSKQQKRQERPAKLKLKMSSQSVQHRNGFKDLLMERSAKICSKILKPILQRAPDDYPQNSVLHRPLLFAISIKSTYDAVKTIWWKPNFGNLPKSAVKSSWRALHRQIVIYDEKMVYFTIPKRFSIVGSRATYGSPR